VIIPSSGVNASRLLMFPAERKAGDRALKAAISTRSSTKGPNSGLETTFCKNDGMPNYLCPEPCMIFR